MPPLRRPKGDVAAGHGSSKGVIEESSNPHPALIAAMRKTAACCAWSFATGVGCLFGGATAWLDRNLGIIDRAERNRPDEVSRDRAGHQLHRDLRQRSRRPGPADVGRPIPFAVNRTERRARDIV